jgi:hypothetical protein
MSIATGIILFILAVVSIAEALALADMWGRVVMLERATYKTKGKK